MKNKYKKIIFLIFPLLLLVIGVSFAYYYIQGFNPMATEDVRVHVHTVDTLTFSISDSIDIEIDQFNFTGNDTNISSEATATAILSPNSKTGSATDNYYLSFYLNGNTTVYSAANTNHEPEYMLQVFDSSNNLVTLDGLGAQRTVGTLTGYDITGKLGLFTILDNHEITASNHTQTTETWRFVVTAINHNFRQNDNTGSVISGKIIVYKTGFDYCEISPNDCISLAVAGMPETVGKTVTPTCSVGTASWNNKYNQLEISGVSSSRLDCTLTYADTTGTTPLNTYLTSLSGTTQGEGKFVHEIGALPDYTSTSIVTTYNVAPVYFQNTFYYLTNPNQTNVGSYWTYSNGTFTSDPSKFTLSGTSNYYHAKIQVPEDGYYQICYNIGVSSNTNNILYINKNSTLPALTSVSSSTSSVTSSCYDLGYILTTDYLNISELGYSGTSSPAMTFRLEKSNNPTAIDTGYRYEGENPNNYVMFNNELWRIIGVFSTEYDSDNNGTTDATANLVKIIREEIIGGLAWDKTNTNDWPNSSLYHLLNEQYYDWETNKATVGTYCYGYSTTVPAKCDYSVKGIQDGYRNMIVKAKWYLGGGGKSDYTTYIPDNMYSYERDANAIYSGRSASTLGYIGLMYASDYLYGVLASDCARFTTHNSYGSANCAGKDWLYGKGQEWTISPGSDHPGYVWNLYYNGFINTGANSNARRVRVARPVLYLSSSVYRVGGTGTITDPYIIGM